VTQVLAPQLFDHGSLGAGTTTPELGKGLYHRITCTASSRTIADPIVAVRSTPTGDVNVPATGPAGPSAGTVLFVEVKNGSGGALTVTWGSAFKGAPVNPANGQRRVHAFVFDGANWVLFANGADVPN
jgi:hypothetical protein